MTFVLFVVNISSQIKAKTTARVWLSRCAAAAMALWLAGCSQVLRTGAEHDPSASFAAYRTYDWMPRAGGTPQGPAGEADDFDWRVRTEVEGQLRNKGLYQRALRPDLLIGYRVQVRELTTDSVQAYYWYRRSGGAESPQETFVQGYEEGTLILDFVDPATKRLLWRGWASAVINRSGQPDRIREAIRQMMQQYPPPP